MDYPTYHDKPPPYTPHPDLTVPIPPNYAPQINVNPASPITRGAYGSSYGTVPTITATRIDIVPPEIIVIGGCPACRTGILEDDYTCLGIFCAIFFFPIGVLFCLLLKDRRCSNCGAHFG